MTTNDSSTNHSPSTATSKKKFTWVKFFKWVFYVPLVTHHTVSALETAVIKFKEFWNDLSLF